MCIILSCKPNKRPNLDVIETCWENNPDGAGLMWCEDGRVSISKGYMKLPDFLRALDSVPSRSPLVVHFRIGTSGGYGACVTHPYPVCDNLEFLHAVDCTCPQGIAHNGVLPYPSDDARGISDTVAYIMQTVTPIARKRRVMRAGGLTHSRYAISELKRTSAGSRLCILDSDGSIAMTGDGWNGVSDGVQASNQSWRKIRYRVTHYDYTSLYDIEDDQSADLEDAMFLCGCMSCVNYDVCKQGAPFCFDIDEINEIMDGEYEPFAWSPKYED